MSLRDSCQAQTTTFRHRRHHMTRFQRWKRQGLTRRERSRYHQTANQRTRRICWREQSIRPVNRKQTVAPPFQFHRIGHFWFVDGPKSFRSVRHLPRRLTGYSTVSIVVFLQSNFLVQKSGHRYPIASPFVHHHVPHFLSTTFLQLSTSSSHVSPQRHTLKNRSKLKTQK